MRQRWIDRRRRPSGGLYNETVRTFMLKVALLAEPPNEPRRPCADQSPSLAVGPCRPRARIALLSNPKSTGNIAQLPRIREYCAEHPDIFHYEVEDADQIGEAMKSIARVRPMVLAINGGDGTVQATLTELTNGGHFSGSPPPVAVLPSGKTNLIALDLGARGDPIETLDQLIRLSRAGHLADYTVAREMIALRRRGAEDRPVIGMFLGGAGLADTMLYCRTKIYPLGLPNGIAHGIAAFALVLKLLLGIKAGFLPADTQPLSLTVPRKGNRISGRFSLVAVTTLEKLLLSSHLAGRRSGVLKLLAVEERPMPVLRGLAASFAGKLGRQKVRGVHFEEADEITIEGENSSVILDGETFRAERGNPIYLRTSQALSFVQLAA